MSVAEPDNRDPSWTTAMVLALRHQGASEEQIAEELRFDSAEDMRNQLENWKLPGWLIGEASGHDRKATQDRDPKKSRGKRKDRNRTTGGPVQEVPPFKDAAPLLEGALNQLRYYLEHLVHLQSGARRTPEYLQDGRFIEDTREDAPLWALQAGGRTRIAGVRPVPGDGRTELIAAYLVAGFDPEPLIEKLRRDPEKLDREKLGRVLYGDEKNRKPGLLERAEQAARLIRGADGIGRWPAEFSVAEMEARHRILDMRAADLSDQEIIERLSREGTPISMADLKWLVGLGLPDPPQ
jgi:hypothetical protein